MQTVTWPQCGIGQIKSEGEMNATSRLSLILFLAIGPSCAMAADCKQLAAEFKRLANEPPPPEFRRHLVNQALSIVGKPADTACEDAKVYSEFRASTVNVQRRLVMECGWKFGTDGSITKDTVDEYVEKEARDNEEATEKMCNSGK